ncbi:TPA: isopeptide-forming domain-containing fimbrial protein [Clostridium perfringens]|uniref:Isopeptide-forming domain-containing fimbrial protein n=3 Tax=Clostridium perfringens TaxID=1502 RepID=A0AAP7BVV8_CLOPF|nr:isopeptide-forming domain-containing fimbrial protein [Clostridium perfringens]EDT24821.1 cell wall surface anchor family protein [Clostridium perfringens B str. ATCC 3626]EIF2086493.1 isopeptide-forming domain-containing fimbrial protein [Clostridium perfringens]EIF6173843.1 isopeptide-forming domain-containing fimbrial protein [Clostridium perfringens]ELC8331654.1 isopeptide-forming domain-containing fimbrial protein [Clostridium perfringens]ELC8344712.1 isopeptide-forming domain-containi
MDKRNFLIKKMISLLAVFAMFLSFGSPLTSKVVKAAGQAPSANDKALGTVNNVEEGSTVTAYQIVKGNYNKDGFTGYTVVNDQVKINDPTKPTSEEIINISKNADVLNSLTKVNMNGNGTTYTADLSAGYWLVLVTPKEGNQTVYNPMLLGIYYSVSGSNNSMQQGTVDANSNWTLNGEKAYAKSSKPTIKKEIENPRSNNAKGSDQAVGQSFNFKITSTIPSYSKEYTNVKYIVTDKLSEGLDYNDDSINVTVNGQVVQKGNDTFTFTEKDSQNIELNFNSDYILKHPGEEVVIKYSAKLNDKATYNFDPNTNDVTLEYSNSPDINKEGTKINDRTYQYTFGIDANLFGNRQDKKKTTSEVIKTDENGKVTNIKREEQEELGNKVEGPLPGAEFKLTPKNGTPGEVLTATSDENGRLKFTGLATGEYELVETKAPEGYALNNEVQNVKIAAEYNENGTLKSYSITINDQNTSTYTATYDGKGNIEKVEDVTNTSIIKNTKLSQLPSTGGMGTYIFTFVGVTLMAGAIGSHFLFGKKKSRV